jgi:hypothetical protein
LLLREETVEYEQDHRPVYQFAGPPAPAKDYRAEVVFTPNAAGSRSFRASLSRPQSANIPTVANNTNCHHLQLTAG